MQVSERSSTDSGVVGSMREGVLELNILLTGKDDSPDNYVLMMNRAGSGGWSTPRHRHNFDQLRYVIQGDYPYAPGKVMPEGWVGYFPESVPYGPQDRPEGLIVLTCQFGGASGNGFLSVKRREEANEALKKKGEFKKGLFTYIDEQGNHHSRDGSEACFEHATGRELTFAQPRYDDLVIMNPSGYEWMTEDTPGVASKWLGAFTERQARFGFLRIDAGATFAAGMEPSIELVFLSKGRISVEGRKYGPHTAFEFRANEGPVGIKAVEQSELLRIILPRF